jgi:hypothetical protein
MFDELYRGIFVAFVVLFLGGIVIGSCATSCTIPYRVRIEKVPAPTPPTKGAP